MVLIKRAGRDRERERQRERKREKRDKNEDTFLSLPPPTYCADSNLFR